MKGGRVGQRERPGSSPAPGWDGGLDRVAEAALEGTGHLENTHCEPEGGGLPLRTQLSASLF